VPCNCGKANGQTKGQNFVYTAPDAKKIIYRTEVEARAAQIRNGGGTYVAVPR
jgi:ferredoxin-NADP reductase